MKRPQHASPPLGRALVALAAALLASGAWAQKTTGGIHGTVASDAGGVAGAQVIAINQDSGFTRETGGFTEFVPLPFVHMEAPIYLKGRARRGPTFREAVLMHAVARLALNPLIPNVQTSWVKMGPEGVKVSLRAGANDLGGTLMDETITRSAGAVHGQEMTPAMMEGTIREIGRVPRQRDTTYRDVTAERYRTSFMPLTGAGAEKNSEPMTVSKR